jgi:ATP-dependent exoDNAse (exonuclease V) alpha subunit
MAHLSKEQQEALDAIARGESIFLSGPGGSGKSFLIRSLKTTFSEKQIAITAMTGCAALLIGQGAKTLHSWAGIGLGKSPIQQLITNIRKIKPLAVRWRTVDILVIDEISMMTPDLLETLDEIARTLRRDDSPMGGIQVVFVGDFFQLPPVSRGIDSLFAFQSPVWSRLLHRTVQLKKIFRQEDTVFQQILSEARVGQLSERSMEILKQQQEKSWKDAAIRPTMLFTRRMDVEGINRSALDDLQGDCKIYTAKVLPVLGYRAADIKKIVDKMDLEAGYVRELYLKLGAQVMLLTNLSENLVNGSRGVVVDFDEKGLPLVQFQSGETKSLSAESWQSEHDNPITVKQIPLRLAYAITIHKAQGATLDCAVIDVGSNTFEYGQAYVALSRMKNLEGLYIHGLSTSAFRAHPLVKDFYKTKVLGVRPPPVRPASEIPVIPGFAELVKKPSQDIRTFFATTVPLAQTVEGPKETKVEEPIAKRVTPPKEKKKVVSYGFIDE